MAKHYQEADYFVPILTPYVQWVHAYRELISALYQEHKTVRRTWKAFKDAIPGVEQRLEFGVFEQILLFSLFLSEWTEGSDAISPDHKVSKTTPDSGHYRENSRDPEPDSVIQELRNVSSERDIALWNLKHLEENAGRLTVQKEDLERQVKNLEMHLAKLENDLGIANENLDRVIHELDAQKAEGAHLRLEGAALREKRASLEDRIQKLLQKSKRPTQGQVQTTCPSAVDGPEVGQGFSQMVIQWIGQATVTGGVIQLSETVTSPKKIGRWNAQRSKDGYYRLYRKIKGRVHSIYIGKELDIGKARMRIAEKEIKLLGINSPADPQRSVR